MVRSPALISVRFPMKTVNLPYNIVIHIYAGSETGLTRDRTITSGFCQFGILQDERIIPGITRNLNVRMTVRHVKNTEHLPLL